MMTTSASFAMAIAGALLGIAYGWVTQRTKTLRHRAICLKAAKRALDQFYDLAERLLADPEMPDTLKHALFDMTLAVTDKEAGQIAFEAVIKGMERSNVDTSETGLAVELNELRAARGDLYDDFYSAVRSAIASLMFAYGPDHSKVAIEFEATRTQSIMLTLMSRLERALSDWIAAGGERQLAKVKAAA